MKKINQICISPPYGRTAGPKSIKRILVSSKVLKSPQKPHAFLIFSPVFLTFSHFFAGFRTFSPPIGAFVRAILPTNQPSQPKNQPKRESSAHHPPIIDLIHPLLSLKTATLPTEKGQARYY